MGDLVVLECDQLFHELVHRFFVKWRLWFAKHGIRNMREFNQRGTRLELELSSGFILTRSRCAPGIWIHSFRLAKPRKSVIEASLPHHLSPLFLNICPEQVRNERTSISRTETTCLAWSSRLFKAKFFERATMGIGRNVEQTLTVELKD